MNKITTITPVQAARFPEWVRKYVELGLSTEPAEFDRAQEAALRAYALCKLKRPTVILRMGSPYGATLGGILAWGFLSKTQVQAQVESQVRAQVGAQVWAQVGDQVKAQVWDQVGAQVGDQVKAQVGAQVRAQVWAQVGSQVGQVWSQVRDQVQAQVRDQAKNAVYNESQGQFWASWVAYVSFLRDVVGWNGDTLPKFGISETLAQTCGWVWWHENICAISDRPSVINRDVRGRLHCATGPSIAYRDGWSLYHWHGVLVPQYAIERPETIKVIAIDTEANAEVRRCLIEIYGQARYLQDSGAELIGSDEFGELYRKSVPDDEPLVMVKVRNSTPEPDGSIKDYFLRVPPGTKTAHEAVAWTFGRTAKNYSPLQQT